MQAYALSKTNLHWFCDKCEEAMFDLPAKNDKIVAMIGDLQLKSDSLEMQLMSNGAEVARENSVS